MRIVFHVKTPTGTSFTVCADSEETVKEIKTRVYGDQWEEYRLIFAGSLLEDDRTLGSYNIQNDCTIHEIRRLPGGGTPPDEDKGVPRTGSMERLADMQQEESSGSCCIN